METFRPVTHSGPGTPQGSLVLSERYWWSPEGIQRVDSQMSVALMTIAIAVNIASQPGASGCKLQEQWVISAEDLGF